MNKTKLNQMIINNYEFIENSFNTDINEIPLYEIRDLLNEISFNRYNNVNDLNLYCEIFNKKVLCDSGIIKGFLNQDIKKGAY